MSAGKRQVSNQQTAPLKEARLIDGSGSKKWSMTPIGIAGTSKLKTASQNNILIIQSASQSPKDVAATDKKPAHFNGYRLNHFEDHQLDIQQWDNSIFSANPPLGSGDISQSAKLHKMEYFLKNSKNGPAMFPYKEEEGTAPRNNKSTVSFYQQGKNQNPAQTAPIAGQASINAESKALTKSEWDQYNSRQMNNRSIRVSKAYQTQANAALNLTSADPASTASSGMTSNPSVMNKNQLKSTITA